MALCLRVWLAVLGAALVGAAWMLWADLPLATALYLAVAASSLSQWMAQWAARAVLSAPWRQGASCNGAGRRWRKWARAAGLGRLGLDGRRYACRRSRCLAADAAGPQRMSWRRLLAAPALARPGAQAPRLPC